MFLDVNPAVAADKFLRQFSTADTTMVQGPGQHFFKDVDGLSQEFDQPFTGALIKKRFSQDFPDVDHELVFLQEPEDFADTFLSRTDP